VDLEGGMKIHEFPASSAQEYMWLAVELDPSRPSYHVPYRIVLTGELRPDALRAAIHDVIARHESLRTSFRYRDGELRQLVRSRLDVDVPLIDLHGHPDAAARAVELTRRAATGGFDLERGPLVRFRLLRTGERRHELIAVVHHLVFDGWSTGVLLDELALAYPAHVAGRAPNLPELEIQYADFARWQRQQVTEKALEPHLAYWRKQLRDAPRYRLVAAGRVSPEAGADECHSFHLPAELSAAIGALAAAQRCTLFVTLLTAFAVLLAGHADEREVFVGTPAANRPRPETAGLIGLFVNMIVIRADLRGEATYRELLGRVRDTVLTGFDAQVPFENVVADLRPARIGRTPFFQAILSVQQSAGARRIGELDAELEEIFTGAAKYDLALGVRVTPNGLTCQFTYSTAVFDRTAAELLAERYRSVLEAMTADPDRCPDHAGEFPSWRVEPVLVREDHGAAPAPEPEQDADPGASRSQLQRTIAEIWCAVLDVEEVGPHDNFFDLGGHSRLMAEVRERLAKAVGRKLSLLDLFEYPTIAALAGYLAGGESPRGHGGAEEIAEQQREARLRLRQRRGSE
jgi:aryl carrier-like protein